MNGDNDNLKNSITDMPCNEDNVFMLVPDTSLRCKKRGSKKAACTSEKIARANALSESAYREALRYGYEIIQFEHNYLKFCAALVDFAGRDVIPHCDFIYNDILANAPGRYSLYWHDITYHHGYWHYENDIFDEYLRIKQFEKKPRKQDFGSSMDELQFLNIKFREKDEFRRMLQFVGRHAYLSPYNAVLVFIQKPESTFVFTGDKWKNDYDRQPKADAAKLITIPSYGRMQCMFDLSDTEPIKERVRNLFNFDYELEDEWNDVLKDERRTDVSTEFRNLCKNLVTCGIFFDWTLKGSDMCAGTMEFYDKKKLHIKAAEPVDYTFDFDSFYRIIVNRRYSEEETFYFICHELARRLCSGDFYCLKNNNKREMTVKEIQFETETVKWLLFRRLGIFNPQEDYLEKYCTDGIVPVCSIERIIKAVSELEKMTNNVVQPTKCLLYREYAEYRSAVKRALNTARKEK